MSFALGLFALSLSCQEKKPIPPISVYFGINYSAMLDSNTYFGVLVGTQYLVRSKDFLCLEGGLTDNTAIGLFGPYGENLVVNRTHVELSYAYKIVGRENGRFALFVQSGIQMQHILYHGKFLGTNNGGFVAAPRPIFETTEYWQPALPIRLRTLTRSAWFGFSVDVFANISKDSDFGIRCIFHLGKLIE